MIAGLATDKQKNSALADQKSIRSFLKWFIPGLGVKRWFGLLIAGSGLVGFGSAVFIVEFYRVRPELFLRYVEQVVDVRIWWLAGFAAFAGLLVLSFAVVQINRAILEPLEMDTDQLIDAVVEHRQRKQGPEIVAVGGGTGMPTLLRGLKSYTSNLTAIVTVADDGGSSGKLRRELGVLPPGDFRNNIVALARDEGMMTQLFQYRFGSDGTLDGHSFGNLLITALNGITGSFEEALIESSRVLAVRGQVLPSTLEDVTLIADMRMVESSNMKRVVGESNIPEAVGKIEQVHLEPEVVPAYPGAIKHILAAELITLGPGSLYTSVMPNVLIPAVAKAIKASRALKVYVCNVATQTGETDDYSAEDHLRAIEQHAGPGICDVVICNNHFPDLEKDANFKYVRREATGSVNGVRFYEANLVDDQHPWRHSSERLGEAIMNLLDSTSLPNQQH